MGIKRQQDLQIPGLKFNQDKVLVGITQDFVDFSTCVRLGTLDFLPSYTQEKYKKFLDKEVLRMTLVSLFVNKTIKPTHNLRILSLRGWDTSIDSKIDFSIPVSEPQDEENK